MVRGGCQPSLEYFKETDMTSWKVHYESCAHGTLKKRHIQYTCAIVKVGLYNIAIYCHQEGFNMI